MDKQDFIFTMLKPIDVGMGVVLGGLDKLSLLERASELTMSGMKALVHAQYTMMNDLQVEQTDLAPQEGGVIFACNHQSWADVQVFGSSCPRRVYFVAKAMFKKWPILRHLIELNGGIYVHRAPASKDQTKTELSSVVEQLKAGKAICIFPEGTIPGEENFPRHMVESDTGLLKGRSGVVRLALEAGVPIVPVGISGTGKAFPPEIYPRLELLRLPGNSPIKIKYGEPIHMDEYYHKDLASTDDGRKTIRELTNNVMTKISELVDHSMHYIPQEVPIQPLPQYDKVGVLLLHGFTSSLDAVNSLVPHLEKEGIEYEMPVMRGHGTKYEDLVGTTSRQWYRDAEKALFKLSERVDKVVVIGFSMGGLIAIDLGINHSDKIAGIETISASIKYSDPLTGMTPLLSNVIKFWPMPSPFQDKELSKKSTNYKKFATDAFASLYNYSIEIEKMLPELEVPIRILHSKKDKMISPVSANIIYENISSKTREIIWFNKSGHEMLHDLEAQDVCVALMEFVGNFKKGKIEETKKDMKFTDAIK